MIAKGGAGLETTSEPGIASSTVRAHRVPIADAPRPSREREGKRRRGRGAARVHLPLRSRWQAPVIARPLLVIAKGACRGDGSRGMPLPATESGETALHRVLVSAKGGGVTARKGRGCEKRRGGEQGGEERLAGFEFLCGR